MKLVISPRAQLALIEIWEHIGDENPTAADSLIEDIQTFSSGILLENPKIGRARAERIWDGTSEIQRQIISRELLRPLGA